MSTGAVAGFADGVYASPTPPPASAAASMTRSGAAGISSSTAISGADAISFKDTVAYFAAKHNQPFQPLPNKTHRLSGKPVYRFGRVPIYLDGTVIYALDDGSGSGGGTGDVTTGAYRPVSFERLLELA